MLLRINRIIGFNNKINFLYVNINNSNEHVVNQPFVKPTYNSECPLRYKNATLPLHDPPHLSST